MTPSTEHQSLVRGHSIDSQISLPSPASITGHVHVPSTPHDHRWSSSSICWDSGIRANTAYTETSPSASFDLSALASAILAKPASASNLHGSTQNALRKGSIEQASDLANVYARPTMATEVTRFILVPVDVVQGMVNEKSKYPGVHKAISTKIISKDHAVLRFDDLRHSEEAFGEVKQSLTATTDQRLPQGYVTVSDYITMVGQHAHQHSVHAEEGIVYATVIAVGVQLSVKMLHERAATEAFLFGPLYCPEKVIGDVSPNSSCLAIRFDFCSVRDADQFRNAFAIRKVARLNNTIAIETTTEDDLFQSLHRAKMTKSTPPRGATTTPAAVIISPTPAQLNAAAIMNLRSPPCGNPYVHRAGPTMVIPGTNQISSIINNPSVNLLDHHNAGGRAQSGISSVDLSSYTTLASTTATAVNGAQAGSVVLPHTSLASRNGIQLFDPMYLPGGSRRTRPNTNPVDIVRIRRGEDVRTTIMLRNIPNKLSVHELKHVLDQTSRGHYDFSYLRIDFTNGMNVGYAFINFVKPVHIANFASSMQHRPWHCYNSDKLAEVSYATKQGIHCLIDAFRNSSVMEEHADHRPKLWYTEEDGQLSGYERPWPAPDNHLKLQRSRDNKGHVGLYPPRTGRAPLAQTLFAHTGVSPSHPMVANANSAQVEDVFTAPPTYGNGVSLFGYYPPRQ